MTSPRVSVIMPTYNGETYIRKAIGSILAQTFTDFDLLVVDDGSTDGTPAILQDLASHDARVRVITRAAPSGGPTIPKNLALSRTTAPYVCFLDHDDLYAPDKLALMVEGLEAHPDWVACFHDLQLMDGDEKHHAGTYLSNAEFTQSAQRYLSATSGDWHECAEDFYLFQSLHYAAIHTASVMLARQRLLADPVSFRLHFRGSDDTDLWLRVGAQGRMGFLNRALAYYRIHGGNLSGDSIRMNENGIAVHQVNFQFARHRMSSDQQQQYKAKIRQYQQSLAYKLCQQKRFSEARAIYRQVLRDGGIYRGAQGMLKTLLYPVLARTTPAGPR